MREIKFRACYKLYGKWHWIYSEDKGLPLFFSIVATKELNPQQYTGLKDMNGKVIYEGDTLKINTADCDYEVQVVWEEDEHIGFTLVPINVFKKYSIYPDLEREEWREVIGNIYENPEIIETSK